MCCGVLCVSSLGRDNPFIKLSFFSPQRLFQQVSTWNKNEKNIAEHYHLGLG